MTKNKLKNICKYTEKYSFLFLLNKNKIKLIIKKISVAET